MKRWHWALVGAAFLAVVILAVCFWPVQTPEAGDDLIAAAEGLDEITIHAIFDPDEQTVQVSQTMVLYNQTGTAQTELVLRTYAAAFRSEDYAPSATEELHDACYPGGFSEGGIEITSDNLTYTYADEDETIMVIALDTLWKSGEELTIRLTYTLTIPDAAYRFGVYNDVYTLGNAFVIPAAYIDGEYAAEEYYSIGDPFVSECRNYTVSVTVPDGYTVAGSGSSETDGQTTTFTALASRDIALCISKKFHEAQTVQDGVLITAYANTSADVKTMLKYAKKAVATFTELFGEYPYPTLSLVECYLPFDGMCYPEVAMIDSDVLELSSEACEVAIVREVAKQWFEAVVGVDAYYQSWQFEALAEYSLLRYWEERRGTSSREDLQYTREDTAMQLTVGDITTGSPLNYYYDWDEYINGTAYRGAAALCALEIALDDKLDGFLSTYYDTYAFEIASREEFLALLNAFSGEDWTPLLEDYLDTIY